MKLNKIFENIKPNPNKLYDFNIYIKIKLNQTRFSNFKKNLKTQI